MATPISAFAQWTQFADVENRIYYIDLGSMRKDGETRTFWILSNFKQRSQYGDMSSRMKEVINCKKETLMHLQFSAFTQTNLGGAMTADYTPDAKWNHIAPQTVNAEKMRIVCSR